MTSASTSTTPMQEVFLFSLQRKGGAALEVAGYTEDKTDISLGDKDFESIVLANGGRKAKWTPQTDESITVKLYPYDEDLQGAGIQQWFQPQSTDDTTQPISVSNTRLRKLHQVIFLWHEDFTGVTTAGQAITADGKRAWRVTAKNVYITAAKYSNDDKVLSVEVTLKWPPFDATGASNLTLDSSDGSADLPVVSSFT